MNDESYAQLQRRVKVLEDYNIYLIKYIMTKWNKDFTRMPKKASKHAA